MRKYNLSLIVAHSNNLVIGKENSLPWKLKDDLKWFKNKTLNKPIIMGSNTFKSLGNKPLPKRLNMVLTNNQINLDEEIIYSEFNRNEFGSYSFKKTEKFDFFTASSLESALYYFDNIDPRHEELMIIGGSKLYNYAISNVDIIYRTIVDCDIDGDAYFPKINESEWKIEDLNQFEKNEENEYSFKIQKLTKLTG
jgi:dihydrofolate reductase